MIKWFASIWAIGLITIVPYGVYYLLFEAAREEYAFWITFVLFWIFGYWGVAGPIVSAIKVRQVFRAIEMAGSSEEIKELIQSNESKEVIIDLIASENHVPKFIARRIYRMFLQRLSEGEALKK